MDKKHRKQLARHQGDAMEHYVNASKRGDDKNAQGALKEIDRLGKQMGIGKGLLK